MDSLTAGMHNSELGRGSIWCRKLVRTGDCQSPFHVKMAVVLSTFYVKMAVALSTFYVKMAVVLILFHGKMAVGLTFLCVGRQ